MMPARPLVPLVLGAVLLPAWAPLQAQVAEVPRTRATEAVSAAFPLALPEEVGLSSADLHELADSVADWVAAGQLVGAEILIIKDRRTVLHEAIGWSDRERGMPLRLNSIYRIRSMTKPVIGTAVLMLKDEGRLSLDDAVAQYLPSFDNDRSRAITIAQLLTHSSGLGDHGFEDIGLPRRPDEYESLRHLVDDIGAIGPAGPPGNFHYSDSGSATLAALVAAISGMPVERFIQSRILAPLGMTDTHAWFAPDSIWAARVNSTYQWTGETPAFERYWDNTRQQRFRYFRGSGGLYSTPLDYARFMTMWLHKGAYEDGRLLSPATVETALRTRAGREYGLHWQVPEAPTVDGMPTLFGHGGSDGTLAIGLPAIGTIVLYFTQSRGPGVRSPFRSALSRIPTFARQVTSSWGATLLAEPSAERMTLTPEELGRYAGTYVGSVVVQGEARLPGQFTYRVHVQDGALTGMLFQRGAQVTVQVSPRHELLPVGDGEFVGSRMSEGLVVEIDHGVSIRFSSGQGPRTAPDRVEIVAEGGSVRWRLDRTSGT